MMEYMNRFAKGSVSDRLRAMAEEYEQHLDSQHILQNSQMQLAVRYKIDTLRAAADQLDAVDKGL